MSSLSLRSRMGLIRCAMLIAAAGLLVLSVTNEVAAQAPGNVIVTVNEFTGSITAPTYLAEYTSSGAYVGNIADVPEPGTNNFPTTQQARGTVLGPDGNIYVYNGTFDPYLARLDAGPNSWTQTTFAGWSTVNNGTYGPLDADQRYLYAGDMETGGIDDAPQGIIRFDLQGGETIRFAENIEPNDLYVGPDGIIYALNGSGSPRDEVFKYDSQTLEFLGEVKIASASHRAVAAWTDGSIFVADNDGIVRRYAADGTLIDSLDTDNIFFADMDIAPDGQIVLGTAFTADIVFTDINLDSFTRFDATGPTGSGSGETFVSWVADPVPEPSTLGLLVTGFVVCLRRRR